MENQVNGFVVLKNLYVTYNDFWDIVEQFKNRFSQKIYLIQSEYFIKDEYLFNGKQLCTRIGSMRENIIRKLHSNGLAEHFGKDKRLYLIEDKYCWSKMRKYITRYVA